MTNLFCQASPEKDEMFRAPQWQAETKRQNQKPAETQPKKTGEREREAEKP
jgi:hypothetical protein